MNESEVSFFENIKNKIGPAIFGRKARPERIELHEYYKQTYQWLQEKKFTKVSWYFKQSKAHG